MDQDAVFITVTAAIVFALSFLIICCVITLTCLLANAGNRQKNWQWHRNRVVSSIIIPHTEHVIQNDNSISDTSSRSSTPCHSTTHSHFLSGNSTPVLLAYASQHSTSREITSNHSQLLGYTVNSKRTSCYAHNSPPPYHEYKELDHQQSDTFSPIPKVYAD